MLVVLTLFVVSCQSPEVVDDSGAGVADDEVESEDEADIETNLEDLDDLDELSDDLDIGFDDLEDIE